MSFRLLICKDSLTDSQILFIVNKRHTRSARRTSHVQINKLMDPQILVNAPLILHNINGSI